MMSVTSFCYAECHAESHYAKRRGTAQRASIKRHGTARFIFQKFPEAIHRKTVNMLFIMSKISQSSVKERISRPKLNIE
jgi:hypothetical protein